MTAEEWRDIGGYEGIAQVSSYGRVRSVSRRVRGRNGVLPGRIKALRLTNSGYYQVALSKDGVQKQHLVHRLVAKAFLPTSNLPEVNHKDEDRLNNCVDNLEWATRSSNAIHSIKKFRGSNSGTARLNEEQVLQIKEILQGDYQTLKQIGDQFGVSMHTIFKIKAGVNWGWLNSRSDLEEVGR